MGYQENDNLRENEMTEQQQQILEALENGDYVSNEEIESGGYYMSADEEPGFHKVTLWYYGDDATSSGTAVEVSVEVEGVTFRYNNSYERWDCDDDDLMSDEINDWLEENIDGSPEYDIQEMLEVQMKTVEDAEELLEDYEYYDVDGELYYYVDDEDNEDDEEIQEMLENAKPISIEEAAQRVLDGDYEFAE